MTPDDESLERAERLTRTLRRWRARRGPWAKPIQLPELGELELPLRVPGDTPAVSATGSLLDRATTYWRPDGTIIGRLDPEDPLDMVRVARESERIKTTWHLCVVGRTRRYRSGVQLTIATSFLGTDQSWGAHDDPVLWESMVFHGHRRSRFYGDGQECWRYASRDAAFLGHRRIVHAITEANRDRRAR